jgi:hypothetical protein
VKKTPLPPDIVSFIEKEVRDWFTLRNHAIHGMAKLHYLHEDTFEERYAKLATAALEGVLVLLQLDQFDVRQKEANKAGRSATWPDALSLTPRVGSLISEHRNKAGELTS